jgi:hypothetical protein
MSKAQRASERVAMSSGVSSTSHNEFIGEQERDLKHQKTLVRALERSRAKAKAKISPETAAAAKESEEQRVKTRAASEKKRKQENDAKLEALQVNRQAARQPAANDRSRPTAKFQAFVNAICDARGPPNFSESSVLTALDKINFSQFEFRKMNQEQRQAWQSAAVQWLLNYEQEYIIPEALRAADGEREATDGEREAGTEVVEISDDSLDFYFTGVIAPKHPRDGQEIIFVPDTTPPSAAPDLSLLPVFPPGHPYFFQPFSSPPKYQKRSQFPEEPRRPTIPEAVALASVQVTEQAIRTREMALHVADPIAHDGAQESCEEVLQPLRIAASQGDHNAHQQFKAVLTQQLRRPRSTLNSDGRSQFTQARDAAEHNNHDDGCRDQEAAEHDVHHNHDDGLKVENSDQKPFGNVLKFIATVTGFSRSRCPGCTLLY